MRKKKIKIPKETKVARKYRITTTKKLLTKVKGNAKLDIKKIRRESLTYRQEF